MALPKPLRHRTTEYWRTQAVAERRIPPFLAFIAVAFVVFGSSSSLLCIAAYQLGSIALLFATTRLTFPGLLRVNLAACACMAQLVSGEWALYHALNLVGLAWLLKHYAEFFHWAAARGNPGGVPTTG
jgi:hypothetical protein